MMTVSRTLLAALCCALISPISLADGPADTGPRALSKAFREAARKATPSVVTIMTYGQNTANSQNAENAPAQNQDPTKRLSGIGSGVIINDNGRVMTNNHVIRGAKRVVVKLPDDTEYEATGITGDADSDIAVLQISREQPFEFASIGDSDSLEIGDWVLAIGSPFRLEATVSAGIISGKNRKLPRVPRSRMLQTDAAINPGNSGGPLVDLDGSLIGISTAIATRSTGYQGIGFAVPINQAKWIADELTNHGEVRRAAIGITMAELNPKIARRVKLKPWLGVLAYQIIEGSVAEQAGMKPMDVIVEFAGQKVRDPGALRVVIEQLPIGSEQAVKVLRSGEEVSLTVVLAPMENPKGKEKEAESEGESEEDSDSTNESKTDSDPSPDRGQESEGDGPTANEKTEEPGDVGADPTAEQADSSEGEKN